MTQKLPAILEHHLEVTEQYDQPMSEAHLLAEAEWQLYQSTQEGSWAYEAHPMQKKALQRYVDRLRAKGVKPKRDFD